MLSSRIPCLELVKKPYWKEDEWTSLRLRLVLENLRKKVERKSQKKKEEVKENKK